MKNALTFNLTEDAFTITSYYGNEDCFTVIPFDGAVICKGDFYSRSETKMPEDLELSKAVVFFPTEDYSWSVVIPRSAVKRRIEQEMLNVIAGAAGYFSCKVSSEEAIIKSNRHISFTFGLPYE
jgi:hypothetical protein